MKKRFVVLLSLTSAAWAASAIAHTFPEKPIRMIVPYPAGGPTDILGRLIAQELSSLPNYEASAWNGIAVPAGTPRTIVERLSSEIAKIVKLASVLDRLVNDGPIPVGSSPDEFQAFIKAEYNKWGKVIREAKLKTE